MFNKIVAAPALAAALIGGSAFAAASAPAAAQYLPPGYYAQQNAVAGVVTSFYQYSLSLQLRSGAIVPVALHPGTVLVPLGLTIQPGMPVIVRGYWSNGTFVANRIRLR